MTEGDPFDCFGGGDEDDHDHNGRSIVNENAASSKPSPPNRDPSNGILAFHAGTEYALLNFVQQELMMMRREVTTEDSDKTAARSNDAALAVLLAIDKFSIERHWMMHVGQEKGRIIQEFLKECVQTSIVGSSVPGETRLLSVVEIGTYCGYSSILLAKTLKDLNCYFSVCSVEVVEQNAQVARKMVELAGMTDCINVLSVQPGHASLEELLTQNMKSDSIDFLFLDHDKSSYLEDLQKLEKSNFIKKNCFVAADNVVFAQIDDYRHYLSVLEKRGTVRTRLATCWLEYSDPDHNGDQERINMMKDGIGKPAKPIETWIVQLFHGLTT